MVLQSPAEIERLRVVLSEAHGDTSGVRISGANVARSISEDAGQPAVETLVVLPVVERKMPVYIRAHFPVSAACFGRKKAGRRISAATRQALAGQRRISSDLLNDRDFWFTPDQRDAPPVRDRSDECGATLKADAISMLEIGAALSIARGDNAGGADSDLIRSAAQMLGFRRVGSDLHARLSERIARTGSSDVDRWRQRWPLVTVNLPEATHHGPTSATHTKTRSAGSRAVS